ncbi:MAG TPA: lipoprotein signal peptidase [Bacteroides sp.]|nr:lipoprotein signal peptidase [Bacteroides sp.]
MSITKKAIFLILGVLLIDQVLKIVIKTNMTIGEEVHVIGNWFILHFTENNGMAFGLDLPGNNGKIFLTLFRIVAITGIGFYMRNLIRIESTVGLILAVALIFAGAAGNIIDSIFYGMIFNDSWGRVASIFPEGGGYATILQGRVVDMFYFPIIRGTWPEWFPWWGGNSLVFFRPVFNIADSAITVGVSIILIWQKRFFAEPILPEKNAQEEKVSAAE